MVTFNEVLEEALEEKQTTLRRLAKEAGCSPATLSRARRGNSMPRPANVRKIAAALGRPEGYVYEAIAEGIKQKRREEDKTATQTG